VRCVENSTPGLSIVSWAHWEDNASRLDVLSIEGVPRFGRRESSMRHTWPNHRRWYHCIRFSNSGLFLAAVADHIIAQATASGHPKDLTKTAHLENLQFHQVGRQERPAFRSVQQGVFTHILVFMCFNPAVSCNTR